MDNKLYGANDERTSNAHHRTFASDCGGAASLRSALTFLHFRFPATCIHAAGCGPSRRTPAAPHSVVTACYRSAPTLTRRTPRHSQLTLTIATRAHCPNSTRFYVLSFSFQSPRLSCATRFGRNLNQYYLTSYISIRLNEAKQRQTTVLDLTRSRGRAGGGCGESGAGAARRVHSPRDIGKRNAEKCAAGACDLGESLTTTADGRAARRRRVQPELDTKRCYLRFEDCLMWPYHMAT
ncbi:unnamed protein product, partial [Iphiclides podalirius]